MSKFNPELELYKHVLKEINNNGKINVLLFDEETTGIIEPEITQFGYTVLEVSLDEEKNLIFKRTEEAEIDYYPSKPLEPKAVEVTSIIREEDIKDKEYIKEIQKVFLNDRKRKITLDQIKKEFHILTPNLPSFKKEDYISLKNRLNIKLNVGHNLYQYDYMEVLHNTYMVDINPIEIFDTLLSDIYNGKKKTNQNRNLSNEATKISSHLPQEEKEELKELLSLREEAHSALIDIKVNESLFKYQFRELHNKYKNIDLSETTETSFSNNNRAYDKDDIIYLRTHMSSNNIISEKQILKYCEENEIQTAIIVEEQWTKFIDLIDKFEKTKTKLILGINVLNKDDNKRYDILIKNTLQYRLLLPLLEESVYINNQSLIDIKKYTENIVMPVEKMETPKYLKKEDNITFYLTDKCLENKAYTQQEIKLLSAKEIKDESLLTGVFTSDVKQDWFKKVLKDYEMIDFCFYEKLNLSAFPPLPILDPYIKKEPETIDEAIDELQKFYDRQWELRELDTIIKKSNYSLKDYENRREKEIAILRKIGKIDFIKYFFLVAKIGDVMEGHLENKPITKDNPNFKKIREAFGYGRGSAPGSLIAFVTGTTGLDPLKYELLFERFIDPSRPDYPDIDIDITNKEYAFNILKQYFDRETMKNIDYTKKPYDIYDEYILNTYIKNKENFIGKIKTTAYTTKKVLLGSLLRLNQFPFFIQSIISKEFDALIKANGGKDKNITIKSVIEQSEMKEDILKRVDIKLFENMDKVADLYKSSGIHAGGVLFFAHHANVILPMRNNVAEFDKKQLERLLQIKMDLLGLKTREALEEIKKLLKKEGKEHLIYKHNFDDLDNPLVYLNFFKKNTAQTFQMGSAGMDRLLVDLSPLKFEDIIAVTALFRPGPLGSGAVDKYISSSIKEKREKYGIEQIPSKVVDALTDMDKKALYERYREELSKDFSPKMITNEMIYNLITSESYYESAKFHKEVENKFNSSDNPIYQEIKSVYKVIDKDDMKRAILDLEEKIEGNKTYQEITSNTYNTMVYQEQIMHISVRLANYTVLESNKLRKAIAKQDPEAMQVQKIKFIKGTTSKLTKKVQYVGQYEMLSAQKNELNEITMFNSKTNKETRFAGFIEKDGIITVNEYTPENLLGTIEELNKQVKDGLAILTILEPEFTELEAKYFWDKIESFGAYAFNKSHAGAYSVFTYETQYYKEVCPAIAYGVYLKMVPEKAKMQLIKEIKNRGLEIKLQKLDENMDTNFTINNEDNIINVPLTYLKGVGDKDLLPFIYLFKNFQIETLEEMLLLAGAKARKKITEKLGQLGVLEQSNKKEGVHFSLISAVEWYYLTGDNEDKDEKGLLHGVIEKSMKSSMIQKEYKQIISSFINESKKKKDFLANIWTNQQLIEALDTLYILSRDLSNFENSMSNLVVDEELDKEYKTMSVLEAEDSREDDKLLLKYYEDVQKANDNLNKIVEKLIANKSLNEVEENILIEEIENKNFDFYKIGIFENNYKEYINYLSPKIKSLSLKLREIIEANYLDANVKLHLSKRLMEGEDINRRELNSGEQADINDKLLKEGNFENNIEMELKKPELMEDTLTLKKGTPCPIINKFHGDNFEYEINKTNVIYLTEFLPKIDKNGFFSVNPNYAQYGSQSQEWFKDLMGRIPPKIRPNFKLAWMSYHMMTEPQYLEKFNSEEYIDKEELEEYNDSRMKNIINNIADSKVENIILATPKKSKLLDLIKRYKFKGFDPQTGDTAVVYLPNSQGEKVKKIFSFVPTMFPYKGLNEQNYWDIIDTTIKSTGLKPYIEE